MGSYSSRGPSAVDFQAKPDLVAPGTGIVSLSDPPSLMFVSKAAYLLKGSLFQNQKPYLSLTGTSMSSPVVAGSVALMLQANPNLTPNLVKAILQYTAQEYPWIQRLDAGRRVPQHQGRRRAGAVLQDRTARPALSLVLRRGARSVLWGNHRISKGVIKPNASAWKPGVVWGAAKSVDGAQHRVGHLLRGRVRQRGVGHRRQPDDLRHWPTASGESDNVVWGTFTNSSGSGEEADNIVWGTMADESDNVVWGTDCDGAPTAPTWFGARARSRSRRTTTSCGARWPRTTTSCGAPAATSTASFGVRRATTKTTISPGEVRATTLRCSTTRTLSRSRSTRRCGKTCSDLDARSSFFTRRATPPVVVPQVLTPLTGGIGGIYHGKDAIPRF